MSSPRPRSGVPASPQNGASSGQEMIRRGESTHPRILAAKRRVEPEISWTSTPRLEPGENDPAYCGMHCEPAITAAEAAKILGLKRPATVLKWAREGKIPCIRMGTGKGAYVRFRASTLDAWMRQQLDSAALPLASSPEV